MAQKKVIEILGYRYFILTQKIKQNTGIEIEN